MAQPQDEPPPRAKHVHPVPEASAVTPLTREQRMDAALEIFFRAAARVLDKRAAAAETKAEKNS